MTEQELQKLKDRYLELSKIKIASREEQRRVDKEIYTLKKNIEKEERELRTQENMSLLKKAVRQHFDNPNRSKSTDQLWMVKINGRTFRSDKGKYTWTSEGRAIAAVSNYLDYHSWILSGFNCNNSSVVKELIKDGYITLVQVY